MANIAQNQDIARRLREVAQLLEDQGANRFRVRVYRAATETIERLAVPAAEIAQQQGKDGLQASG
jgi:putative hydrolase